MRSAIPLTLLAAVAAAPLATPSGAAPAKRQPGAATRRKPAALTKPAGARPPAKPGLDDYPLIARLTPVESGPGVVVCEPVPHETDADLAHFGDGCGRWLNLIVGGQPQLGKTPLWSAVDAARIELKRSDLRIGLDEAPKLAAMLGITHVAVGELTGKRDNCTLAYRLWQFPDRKPIGEPQILTGTTDAVYAGLPRMAAALSKLLGVTSPSIPDNLEETAYDLEVAGGFPWVPGEQTANMGRLITAATPGTRYPSGEQLRPRRMAVTELLFVINRGELEDRRVLPVTAGRLLAVLPENTQVLATIAQEAHHARMHDLKDIPLTQLQPLLARFPNCALLQTARSYAAYATADPAEARAAAAQAVRCARGNPFAWTLLADTIGDQAQAIRKGRFINEMTPEELKRIDVYYHDWLPVALKAVQVDPNNGRSWLIVSSAAAFLGVGDLADRAFWKCIAAQPQNPRFFWWGIQLYQPKWVDDPGKLQRVARMVIEASSDWTLAQRLDLAIPMTHAGLTEQAGKLMRTDAERAELKSLLEPHEKGQ